MGSRNPKVAIIGAGNVGSTFAFALLMSGLAREIVLIDQNRKKADGECSDLAHGLSFTRPAEIRADGYNGCAGADLVVITAGVGQKPGQTRIDLVKANVAILKEMMPQVVHHAGEAVILLVTNPVDVLTYAALKLSGLPSHRVIGSGTVLDTSRLRYLISKHCIVDPRNVHAYIIGEHGDTELPVWSNATIGGMRLAHYCPSCVRRDGCQREKELGRLFEDTKNAAYRIIEAKGSTYYAIALALVKIAGAIVRDEYSILPVSTLIDDYYGVGDVCMGIPSLVNRHGVANFLRLELSEDEQQQFRSSARALREVIARIDW